MGIAALHPSYWLGRRQTMIDKFNGVTRPAQRGSAAGPSRETPTSILP